ncbi:MAG: hypothetical protein J6R32_08580 [Bacteroidales bacterium]|nr:hypothetical protein [Bacteroidales bacterium]
MSYSVTLYTNSSSNNTADKVITQIGETSFTANPTHSISVLNPDIVVTYDASYLLCNYVYIALFNRYYYCTIETDTAQRMILHCSVDALTTAYKLHSLSSKSVSVVRSESEGASDIIDKSFPVNPSKIWYEGIVLPNNDLTENSYPYIISVNSTYS